MREILFRGKRADNGEWVEGDLVRIYGICFIVSDVTKETYAVQHNTIGQFTGILDMNDKKIFEGDFVEFEIIRDAGCYPHTEKAYAEVKCKNGVFNPFNICVPDPKTIQVMWNIHDKTEELE